MNTADGKHTMFSDEITEAFIEEVLEEKPDYVLISGDLTFNGEKISHLELKKKLDRLRENGIQTIVIPGNHDVNYPFSWKYSCDSCQDVDNITAEEFKQIYDAYGYGQAISQDKSSLSYIYPLTEDIWLFCLDCNVNGHKGKLSKETMEWVKPWLKKAKEQHKVIFSMTHQNILSHNLLTSPGYVLFNNDEVFKLLDSANATLNFSGHMHVQHIKTMGKFSTIASGSLCVSPNLYGVMEIDKKRHIDYHAKKLNVSEWAKRYGIKNHKLLNFERESRNHFNTVWGWQINQELEEYNIPSMERVGLVDFCVRVINKYLAGETFLYRKEFLENPLYVKWQKKAPNSFFASYLASILEDPANSGTDIELHVQANRNLKKRNYCE